MTSSAETHTKVYNHINGGPSGLLNRLAVAELCRGWPVYRDASEWMNFRSLFAKEAHVFTTWSGLCDIDEFIKLSKDGKDTGVWIQHRECGTMVELSPTHPHRAIGKMKATITHRFREFTTDNFYDVDCDCRFIFFCQRDETNDWRTYFVKLIYEKDKVVAVDGKFVPEFESDELACYPDGFKYLGAAQARMGFVVDPSLATVQHKKSVDRMYKAMEDWLDGNQPDLLWGKYPGGYQIY